MNCCHAINGDVHDHSRAQLQGHHVFCWRLPQQLALLHLHRGLEAGVVLELLQLHITGQGEVGESAMKAEALRRTEPKGAAAASFSHSLNLASGHQPHKSKDAPRACVLLPKSTQQSLCERALGWMPPCGAWRTAAAAAADTGTVAGSPAAACSASSSKAARSTDPAVLAPRWCRKRRSAPMLQLRKSGAGAVILRLRSKDGSSGSQAPEALIASLSTSA